MLEADGVLETWRLARPPESSDGAIEATALADHRLIYLEYEGPVSGNRGSVKRWDLGVFDEGPDSTPDVRNFMLQGSRVRAQVRLERVAGTNWSFRMLLFESRR